MTPQEAADRAKEALPEQWEVTGIYEDPDLYVVSYGRPDGRPLINVPLIAVQKSNGDLGLLQYRGNEDRIDAMSEVG